MLFGPINKVLPSYFDNIDESMIKNAARLTKGAGGPSQLDAEQYRHVLLSTKYKKESKDLHDQIAILAKKLATCLVDPNSIDAFVACRLIPLNKNPGVRPIGIGEVLKRIFGKAIGWVLKSDIQEAATPLQAATGLKGGAEAAIHAMKSNFEDESREAVILVDASTAFNRLNRQVSLHNIQTTCPQFATILVNTHREPTRMVILGGKEILSTEGTTQGDNLAMTFYALGTTLLQNALRTAAPHVKQVWLVDDATVAGTLTNLKTWWDTIFIQGTKIGYNVNQNKSWLKLKDKNNRQTAKDMFRDTEIQITTDGKRNLGATIGTDNFRSDYITGKVKEWCDEIQKLSEYSKSQPQAAYSAFCHGVQHKYTYFMRTIPEMENFMQPLDNMINETLLLFLTL